MWRYFQYLRSLNRLKLLQLYEVSVHTLGDSIALGGHYRHLSACAAYHSVPAVDSNTLSAWFKTVVREAYVAQVSGDLYPEFQREQGNSIKSQDCFSRNGVVYIALLYTVCRGSLVDACNVPLDSGMRYPAYIALQDIEKAMSIVMASGLPYGTI